MKHELISSNLTFLLLTIILNCVFIKEIFSQDLSGPYLGQKAPGLKAVRFSPEGYSANDDWFWHGPLSFSPDGTELYMTKYLGGDKMQLNWAIEKNGNWTLLKPIAFAGERDENNPIIFFDGTKLFFISGREGGRFWTVDRTNNGWSEPKPVMIPTPHGKGYGWQMSVARDQSIYFDYMIGNDFYIYVSRYINGVYQTPEQLPEEVNAGGAFCPFIDPEEAYLIFASMREGSMGGFDLYVSFNNNGEWSNPRNMGNIINTSAEEFAPYVSLDGKYLFFFSLRSGDHCYNPYWISAEVIESLR